MTDAPHPAAPDPLRLAFMGSAAFSLPTLIALVSAGHAIIKVYTQPPRPAGRGHQPRRSPVHVWAESQSLEVHTPTSLRSADEQRAFAELGLDVAVVVAYGLILPQPILQAPRLGCLNVHGSLLPRWRGAAPIERAVLAGDTETGITIMQMDAGLDTGPMLLAGRVPISPETTAAMLHDVLAERGAALLLQALDGVVTGTLQATPQPAEGATYAQKLAKDEGRIDWRQPAAALERAVRALNPQPGVWFAHAGERIKVLRAEPADGSGAPGVVLDQRLSVACGVGALRPLLLQRAGRGPTDVDAFLRGYPLPPGTVLERGPASAGGNDTHVHEA